VKYSHRICAALLGTVLFCSQPARAEEEASAAAIGGLSASFLMQSYFNIALLADLSMKEGAEMEHLNTVLATVEGLISGNQTHLDALIKSDIDEEGKAFLKKIKSASALLDEEISLLRAFWKDKSQKNAKAFDDSRNAAWKKISETLDLK
jgi:hypothetical protein